MGGRLAFTANTKSQEPRYPRPPRLSIASCLQLQETRRNQRHEATNSSYVRRDGHAEAQESLGGCPRARQEPSHDGHHDVHVRQLASDLQHHDGLHGLQNAVDGTVQYQSSFRTVRDGEQQGEDAAGQGSLCVDAMCRPGFGGVEDQCYGSIANYEVGLVGLGGAEGTAGVCCSCIIGYEAYALQ